VKAQTWFLFSNLQAWFGVVANPCKQWDQEVITDILMACVVLHNMTIEDEHNLNLEPFLMWKKTQHSEKEFIWELF
jgi:hypothetical protein